MIHYKRIAKKLVKKDKIKKEINSLYWDYAEQEYIYTNRYETQRLRFYALSKMTRISKRIRKLNKRLDKLN